ncbi:LAMI_0D05226g1_1 [Lachancea mirantina]|uniref:Glutamyl-tRNA(Gln) amidotransferase subunit B, mitochondrial n=1 Tax=Lachancea mirantina TaxID=1230905 RepID=A0A1G4JB04_9SACH|nr:LAMI_0D05226g1_1 [Lachancea mirantina]
MLRYRSALKVWGSRKYSVLLPEFKLKCGLEIHTQLCTKNKLFSLSTNDAFAAADKPNYHASYFDVSLPGSQPKLNYEAILFATKLAVALNCQVSPVSQFDRKHYFYGDQPLGYQITQHFAPFAKNGYLELSKDLDGIDQEHRKIEIMQLQIEQDTGKSIYRDNEKLSLIDLNRSNVPLIEMVTHPQFTDWKEVRAFIKKYQALLRSLGISTGDLETGAMRVDVNVSVNDNARVELKNLPNTSSILKAIQFEYDRHVHIIKEGNQHKLLAQTETRSWNGYSTARLRGKETSIDYRYMPDPEIPVVKVSQELISTVAQSIPALPDAILRKLISQPFNLSLKDAKILAFASNGHGELYSQAELLPFYIKTFENYQEKAGKRVETKLPTSWIIHELLGNINKLSLPFSDVIKVLTPTSFSEFLILMTEGKISRPSAKLLLFHILKDLQQRQDKVPHQSIDFQSLIKEYGLNELKNVDQEELDELCSSIIKEVDNPALIEAIKTGQKRNSIKFLVGQGMRLSQGRIKPQLFEKTFKKLLRVDW